VENLPFESARVKAGHYHWSDKCSHGIQQMLAGRQQRHDAALQALFAVRCAANSTDPCAGKVLVLAGVSYFSESLALCQIIV